MYVYIISICSTQLSCSEMSMGKDAKQAPFIMICRASQDG